MKALVEKLQYWVSQNRIVTSIVLALILLIFARPTLASILWGLPILFIGEVIRIYSIGYIKKDSEVTRDGPYSLTRNPLYLGNFFLLMGFVMISKQWVLIPVYLGLFYFIYDATMKDEEQRLSRKFGKLYDEYKATVPRFFPALGNGAAFRKILSRKVVFKKRELNTCFGIVGGVLLAYFKMLMIS